MEVEVVDEGPGRRAELELERECPREPGGPLYVRTMTGCE